MIKKSKKPFEFKKLGKTNRGDDMKKTNFLFSIFLLLMVVMTVMTVITLCFFYDKVRYIILASEVIFFSGIFLLIQFLTLKQEKKKEQQQIALASESFFHQFVNCIESIKKSLEKGSPSLYEYDVMERITSQFLYLLHTLHPTMQIFHLDQAFLHYIKNVEEIHQYLFEVQKSIKIASEKEKNPLYERLEKEDSIYVLMENSVVFLDDYLDILLIEIYPFLDKNKKRNFVSYCKNIQENE